MKSLYIAIPTYNNNIDSSFAQSLIKAVIAMSGKVNYSIKFYTEDAYLDRLRNRIADEFLQTNFEKLMMLDADMIWNENDFMKFLENDDLVTFGLYPIKRLTQNKWAAWNVREENGRIVVDFGGTGFCTIKREVFEKIKPYSLYYSEASEISHKLYGFFDRIGSPISNDARLGEDFSFCERCRLAGIKLYADPQIKFAHCGRHVFTEND